MVDIPARFRTTDADWAETTDADLGAEIDGQVYAPNLSIREQAGPKRPRGRSPDGQQSWSSGQILSHLPSQYVLVGMGEPGESCGALRLSHWTEGAPSTDGKTAVLYSHLNCNRVTCPNCYSHVQLGRVFDYAVYIESYARWLQERPAAVVVSVDPRSSVGWTWQESNTHLHRRGIRHLRGIGAKGGYRFYHPFRIREWAKRRLRAEGFGKGGPGLWQGVREDALELGDWREYIKWGPHDHHIVFPSYLREHRDKDLVLSKYAMLATVEDVVKHIRYLLSHTAKVEGTNDKSASAWGFIKGHRTTVDKNGNTVKIALKWRPEDHLSEGELNALKTEIAELLGMVYNIEEGTLEYPPDPVLDKIPWRPVWELTQMIRDRDFRESLDFKAYEYLDNLVHILYGDEIDGVGNLDSRLLHEEVEPLRPDAVRAYYRHPPPEDPEDLDDMDDPDLLDKEGPWELEDMAPDAVGHLASEGLAPLREAPEITVEVHRNVRERVYAKKIYWMCFRCHAAIGEVEPGRPPPWVCDVNRGGCGRRADPNDPDPGGTVFVEVPYHYDEERGHYMADFSPLQRHSEIMDEWRRDREEWR